MYANSGGKLEGAFNAVCGGHATCDLSQPLFHSISVFMRFVVFEEGLIILHFPEKLPNVTRP